MEPPHTSTHFEKIALPDSFRVYLKLSSELVAVQKTSYQSVIDTMPCVVCSSTDNISMAPQGSVFLLCCHTNFVRYTSSFPAARSYVLRVQERDENLRHAAWLITARLAVQDLNESRREGFLTFFKCERSKSVLTFTLFELGYLMYLYHKPLRFGSGLATRGSS